MKIEKVGLMTPGDMGQAVAMQIKARGFTVCTALDKRSERSRALAREAASVPRRAARRKRASYQPLASRSSRRPAP